MNMLHFWGGVQKSTVEKCMQMGELDLPSCSYISVRGGCHPKPFLHQSKAYQNYNQNRWKQCRIFCASAPLAESLAATCPRVKMNASRKMQSHPVKFDFATFGPRNVLMESYGLSAFLKCVSSISWKLSQPIGTTQFCDGIFHYSLISCCPELVCVQAVTLECLLILAHVLLPCPKLSSVACELCSKCHEPSSAVSGESCGLYALISVASSTITSDLQTD